jgi:uncharacterized lipoprotein YmbA
MKHLIPLIPLILALALTSCAVSKPSTRYFTITEVNGPTFIATDGKQRVVFFTTDEVWIGRKITVSRGGTIK